MVRTGLIAGFLLTAMAGLALAGDAEGLAAFRGGDIATAVREWRAAADAGNPDAQVNLGVLYAKGKGVDQDMSEAMRLYTASADQGNALAQYLLAEMYAKGWGVQSEATTLRWSQVLASRADEPAEDIYAALDGGYGLEENDAAAVYYYRLSALHGFAPAEFSLAQTIERGKGAKRDPAEAFQWYLKSADQGNGQAAAALSELYAKGEGVTADPEKALFWMDIAAKAREKSAEKWRQRVAAKLTPEAIARAQNEATAWKPMALK